MKYDGEFEFFQFMHLAADMNEWKRQIGDEGESG
jgi:hypothetical protein